jgi:Carboxypeptidase regulatory-like domain
MKFFGFLTLILMMCLLSATVLGQTATTGLLQGTVTDPQGAVLPGVEVKLLDRTTNQSRVEMTNEDGLFTFVNVPPGNYSLTVTKQGFRTSRIAELTVEVNKSYTFPIGLEVGQATEIVTVQADSGAELQTTDSSVGNVVGTRMLRQLPTATRNTLELISLQPTTTPGGFGSGGTVSGARSDQNTIILDGIDVSDNLAGGQGVAITQAPVGVDAISEFRVTVDDRPAARSRSSARAVGTPFTASFIGITKMTI